MMLIIETFMNIANRISYIYFHRIAFNKRKTVILLKWNLKQIDRPDHNVYIVCFKVLNQIMFFKKFIYQVQASINLTKILNIF